jgi:dipeptidyl aminopeptidase/acylaminoacyl peptidase
MKRFWAAWLAAVWLCLAHAADAARPPVEAFGTVPAVNDVSLSPNGQLLAWIDNSGAHPRVQIFDLAKGDSLLRMNPDGLKVRGIVWSDDETLLISVSLTRTMRLTGGDMNVEFVRTSALNVRTRKNVVLLADKEEFAYVSNARLLLPRTETPKKVLMASWFWSTVNYKQETGSRLVGGRKDAGWTYNLFEVDTQTGTSNMLHAGSPYTTDWVVDAKNQPVARVEWNPDSSRFSVLHRRGQGWTEILNLATGEQPSVRGETDDGSLLMFGALGRDRSSLWRLPVDGSAPRIMLEDEQYEIAYPLSDTYSRRILGVWLEGPEPRVRWLDESARKRSEALHKTFAGAYSRIIGRSADNSRVLVEVSTRSKPSTFYLVDYKRGAADIVGEAYPLLANAALGEVQTLSYKARDGYEITAYLTLPAGADPKQLPLIALPHGGPESRDEPVFDWLAQFLASRGYAVLQPQFRGSTGFGDAHRRAGYRQWGKLMQDDVTDGVKAMIEQGVADPGRICIAGASYGGYAALAGAAFTPELYACAISINGVSDLPIMLGYERAFHGRESDSVAYWSDHIGSRTDEQVIAKSPARNVTNVRAPILLLHAKNDTVVPPEQARVMVKALQDKGKAVKFVELPGEDHWLSLSESRTRVLAEMEAFLAEHLAVKAGS